jgi:peroxiredoxin
MKLNFSPKTILVETIKLIVMIVIVANIVSYIKKPELADKTLPNISIKLLNGETKSLHAYTGKPVILYFWGSWCPICKMSSPVISDLSENYQVITFAVNSGSDEEIKHFMQKHQLHFPVVNDAEGTVAQQFGVNTFPTTFIYNAKGTNTFTDVGYTSTLSLRFKIWLSKFI